jgi:hypothetical protein
MRRNQRSRVLWHEAAGALVLAVLAVVVIAGPASAHDPDANPEGDKTAADHGHASLGDIGAKLSDPTSNVWALFTEFDLSFSDGDVNRGDPKIGGDMVFQPILPIPLYGEGKDQWKILARPTVPLIFSSAVPKGLNSFDHETGLGDITLPLPLAPPPRMSGHWILGLGPTFLLPTATKDAFGSEQFGIGPAAVIGYKTKKFTLGIFPQYYFKIGSIGDQADKPNVSNGSLLYFGFWNLPKAWQIGFNPVITYDDKATKGNKWNVPVGLLVTKTTAIAKKPVKLQIGFEYSVVSQDDFGKRFMIKVNVIPVIAALVKNPIFGGGG